ncbi:MAG: 2-C-methyl-D-erythritol 2,4-cyclodiphosphate synthase [Oscillospiraceae bacterium]|nr:2-C-methyl-D-erythritol 2,4-cyclodiphosphate synthase [Oscillospiraceae bacterium]
MFRVGFGYDAHKFVLGRKCILCGVEIPCEFGPDGHSDADVPVHALMDALLGALALGDIGKHFPDTDESFSGADSISLLSHVYALIRKNNYALSNADITMVMEKPRIASYVDQMRETIATALNIDLNQISIKGTTEEKMGFTGEGLGMKSYAVVLLNKIANN